ncbi:hypothetical protein MNBD_UNCLBAC01-533 [hydrothermal vent metagenome]|uniref:Zn-ribbon-containing, possibly RNA-binding protein and truncated derivatives n=1 Tax=hydrothermal vent metagenome TaxID=652676 RepID=A0A3B1DF37_9ZZZZ
MDNVKNIIQDVIGKIANREKQEYEKIERIWQNILKEQELKHTHLSGVKDGVVFVLVDSPAWLYQMKIRKRRILDRLKDEIEEIKNIYFKLGKWND